MKSFCTALFISCFQLLASNAWSCSVCFGEGNSELQRGFYWGILLLLLLPPVLIAAIGFKIVRSSARKDFSSAAR